MGTNRELFFQLDSLFNKFSATKCCFKIHNFKVCFLEFIIAPVTNKPLQVYRAESYQFFSLGTPASGPSVSIWGLQDSSVDCFLEACIFTIFISTLWNNGASSINLQTRGGVNFFNSRYPLDVFNVELHAVEKYTLV